MAAELTLAELHSLIVIASSTLEDHSTGARVAFSAPGTEMNAQHWRLVDAGCLTRIGTDAYAGDTFALTETGAELAGEKACSVAQHWNRLAAEVALDETLDHSQRPRLSLIYQMRGALCRLHADSQRRASCLH